MAIFIALAVGFINYLIASAFYNLHFHPLAKTPGPFWSHISTFPSFYHACKGDRHIWIWQNFQIYGDKFRAAPNLILFNSPRAYSDIHGPRANITRSSFYRAWQRNEDDVSTMSATEPKLHSKKRRLLNLAFNDQSMKGASPIVNSHVNRWVDLLLDPTANIDGSPEYEKGEPDGWSPPRNMANWTTCVFFDMLGDLCFGQSFSTKEPGKSSMREIPHLVMKRVAMGYKLSKTPLLDFFLSLRSYGINKFLESIQNEVVREYNSFIHGNVEKRVAAHQERSSDSSISPKPDREDIFHFLLSAIDPDTGLPAYTKRENLLAEARLLVLAGSDSLSIALTSLLFYLSHNPRVLSKLREEIRGTFDSPEEIVVGAKLSKLRYLRACIDETLRLAHPIPSEMPREILKGGAVIDGNSYPAGTVVGCCGWSMGRDEHVYGDAHTYRPERWIPSTHPDTLNTEEDVSRLQSAFHPFSMGSMNCAGQKLALLELTMITAQMVWRTEFRLAPNQKTVGEGTSDLGWGQRNPQEYMVWDAYLSIKNGPMLQFRARSE